jgi:hypothetical protein
MEQTFRKIKICPVGKGEGTIKVGNLRECHNHDIEQCGECNGKGILLRTIIIKYEKIC